MATSMINREISVPVNSFRFAATDSQTRQLNDVSQYQAISSIPLFDEDRRPEKKVVAIKVVQKKVEKQLKVQALGIAVSGDGLLAVVKDLRTGRIYRLRVDDAVDGWTLTDVSAERFIFAKAGVEKSVKFKTN